MIGDVSKALAATFRNRRSILIIVSTFFTLIILNIVMLVGAQWAISGEPPMEFGLFSTPPESKDLAVIWIKSGYYTLPGLRGDTYWIVFITPSLFLAIVAASLSASILFAELDIMSRIGKRCRVEKGAGSIGSFFIVFGSASAASSILSCPSCNFTLLTTVATITTASVTGTTFGLSSLAIKLAPYLMLTGAIFNLIIIIIVSKRLAPYIK